MPLRQHKSKAWGKVDQIIEQWLKERQELLVIYYQLSHVMPFSEDQLESNEQEILANFCQILTDYVSVGHFEVFERLFAASSDNKIIAELDNEIFKRILTTTDKLISFCNKYAKSNTKKNLSIALSTLGEELARRMDLEDNLIKVYLNYTAKNPLVAPNRPAM